MAEINTFKENFNYNSPQKSIKKAFKDADAKESSNNLVYPTTIQKSILSNDPSMKASAKESSKKSVMTKIHEHPLNYFGSSDKNWFCDSKRQQGCVDCDINGTGDFDKVDKVNRNELEVSKCTDCQFNICSNCFAMNRIIHYDANINFDENLSSAIIENDLVRFKTNFESYLNRNDVNLKNYLGDTLMHLAVTSYKQNSDDLISYLISKNADFTITNKEGQSSLLIAAKNGFVSLVKLFLKTLVNRKKSLQIVNEVLIEVNNLDIVKMLKAWKSDYHSLFDMDAQPKHDMEEKDLLNNVIFQFKSLSTDKSIAETSFADFEKLMLSCKENNLEDLEALISSNNNANFDMIDKKTDMTALMTAANYGHNKIALRLIKAGVNINLVNSKNMTALYVACCEDHINIVQLLLDEGADCNIRENNTICESALAAAARKNNSKIVKLLLQYQIIYDIDNTKSYPYDKTSLVDIKIALSSIHKIHKSLLAAARESNLVELKAILAAGGNININFRDKNMKTSLMLASEKGFFETVGVLIEYNADLNLIDNCNNNALCLAIDCMSEYEEKEERNKNKDYFKVIRILIKAGIDINKGSFTDRNKRNSDKNQYIGETALYKASHHGLINVVQLLIDNPKCDINAAEKEDGYTPLIIAVINKHYDIVKVLLDRSADINKVTINGTTALYWAAKVGHSKITSLLVETGADVNIIEPQLGDTPLSVAVRKGISAVVTILLSSSAKYLNRLDFETPYSLASSDEIKNILKSVHTLHEDFISACESGDTVKVEQLLSMPNVNINYQDTNGYTGLMKAVEGCNSNLVQFLIESNASVNEFNKKKQPALYLAVSSSESNFKIVEALLKAKADITGSINDSQIKKPINPINSDSSDDDESFSQFLKSFSLSPKKADKKYNPLLKACELDCTDIIRVLIKYGSGLNTFNEEGFTPLMICAKKRYCNSLKVILDAKPNFYEVDKTNSMTALSIAAELGYSDIIAIFIESGVDVNFVDKTKTTALYWASREGHTNVMQQLINAKADIHVVEITVGDNSLGVAARKGKLAAVQLLIDCGAKFSSNNSFQSVYDTAASKEIKDLIMPLKLSNDKFIAALKDNDLIEAKNCLCLPGVNVNFKNKKSFNALFNAAENNNEELVRLLIEYGADLNMVALTGYTVLLNSLNTENINGAIVEILIKGGADINISNNGGRTALFKAATVGHLNSIKLLIDSGADVNKGDEDGDTPLNAAISSENWEAVEMLITAGAVVNQCNKSGASPLYFASGKDQIEIVRLLIKAGADVNKCDEDNDSPLYSASTNGYNLHILEALIEAGADVNKVNNRNKTALLKAAENSQIDMVKVLLKAGADINKRNNDGDTALYTAVENGIIELVEVLIKEGADLNIVHSNNEKSPLFKAVSSGTGVNLNIAEILIMTGRCDVNKCESAYDKSPLYIASKEGYENIVEMLLKFNANVNKIESEFKETPLITATTGGRTKIVKMLLNANADFRYSNHKSGLNIQYQEIKELIITYRENVDEFLRLIKSTGNVLEIENFLNVGRVHVDCTDEDGNSALILSTQLGYLDVINILLKFKADVNKVNKIGETVIHKSLELDRIDVFNLLLAQDADVNLSDNNNRTLLHVAAKRGHSSVVELLLNDKNMSINSLSKENETPLHEAAESGNVDLVKMFLRNYAFIYASSRSNNQEACNNSVLSKAARNGHLEVVKLLKENGVLDYSDVQKSVLIACECGYFEIVQYLLDNENSSVYFRNEEDSIISDHHILYKRGLLKAIDKNQIKMVNILLDYIDINTEDESGEFPFFHAIDRECIEIVKCFLQRNVDVSKTDFSDESSALMKAVRTGNIELVKLLVDANVNPLHINREGQTSLHIAAYCGFKDVVSYLIMKIYDLNIFQYDKKGRSPIQLAGENHHYEVVQVLLNKMTRYLSSLYDFKNEIITTFETLVSQYCVNDFNMEEKSKKTKTLLNCLNDIHASVLTAIDKNDLKDFHILLALPYINIEYNDSEGNTFLMYVVKKGNIEMTTCLINKYNANIQACNTNLDTSLSLSIKNSDKEIATLLLQKGSKYNSQDKVKLIELGAIFPLDDLLADNSSFWFELILMNDVDQTVKVHVEKYPSLAQVKDSTGRKAIDIAISKNKIAMKSVFSWHNKYELINMRPDHISGTCHVYRAQDTHQKDENDRYLQVALKLMTHKAHYISEVKVRYHNNFNSNFAINILESYPKMENLNSFDDIIEDSSNAFKEGLITKQTAEKMFCIVMPLADRNMFVSLKQDRFAGNNNIDMVRVIFKQMVQCIDHIHGKGILHGDIKTLNIVRTGSQWSLIDFDASCRIGLDSTCRKYSSSYLPPEALFITDSKRVVIRSDENCRKMLNCTSLVAHPSFDIWSLGCVLYQMCSKDVLPLFQGGLDDNLSDDRNDFENLYLLEEWSDGTKARKLSKIENKYAANLLWQILTKDPMKRPDLNRIMNHPFLTQKKVTRMNGEKPQFDVFISYRVNSDLTIAKYIYDDLTAKGLKVWWDKECIELGKDWETAFCEGLINSNTFLCLLSRSGSENFNNLTPSSNCDNVLLECQLALELFQIGFIKKIIPVLIGDYNSNSDSYESVFNHGCCIAHGVDKVIDSILLKLIHHMDVQSLGSPLMPDRTVSSVVKTLLAIQGILIEGDKHKTLSSCTDSLYNNISDVTSGVTTITDYDSNQINYLTAKNNQLEEEIRLLKERLIYFESHQH